MTVRIETILKVLTYGTALVSYSAVAQYINTLFSVGFCSLLIVSLMKDFTRKRWNVPPWSLNLLALLVLGAGFSRMTSGNIVIPGVEVLVILLALKFAEDKKSRDYMQIYALSMFVLAASTLLSLDMYFLVCLVTFLFLLCAAILTLSYFSEDPEFLVDTTVARTLAIYSLLIPVLVLPTAAVLFPVLPRTNYPLFDFLGRTTLGKSGFTDNVMLGAVSSIQEDDTIVFRAQMAQISDRDLYWRGLVFDSFDGITWRHLQRERKGTVPRGMPGQRVRYTIYLEPFENGTVFALDKPQHFGLRGMTMTEDLICSLPQPAARSIRYSAYSILSNVIPGPEKARETWLQLPPGMERIKDLTNELTRGKDGPASVQAILSYLKSGRYAYALKNLPLSREPVEDFLFRHRYGNCEYFASSMAVMLRARGIPARLVGGYLGGYYNDVGRYYAVPQRNAHVWVEAYLDGAGWIRCDPTPALTGVFSSAAERGIIFAMRIALDSIQYYWNIFVISYDLQTQFLLFSKLENAVKASPRWFALNRKAVLVSVLSLLALAAVISLYILLVRLRRRPREELVLRSFLRKMKGLGYRKDVSTGLEEFVCQLPEGATRAQAERFVNAFERLYYRDIGMTKADARALRRLIADIISP